MPPDFAKDNQTDGLEHDSVFGSKGHLLFT